jgi:hypothetical protein
MIRTPSLTSRRRRIAVLGSVFSVAMLVGMILVPSAQAVLPGSPSKFESGNDPSLGLGNMVVNTIGNNDWKTVAFEHITDLAASTSDDSFTPGQKQDTVCPTIEGHKNPPKDDFTDVASFTEVSADEETYLYGATIRYAANGNASENIELKQGLNGECTDGFLARTAGDKMIAIDYLGGGKAVEFHVLTWVTTGACYVANDPTPCWGADVLTLNPTVAEGGVSTAVIVAADNPINGKRLLAGQFAEFGINLADAGIIPAGSCKTFTQTIWESRAAGSSFVSSTKDIAIEDKDINNCASVSVNKTGSDGGSQAGAEFTLYEGSDTTGTVVGSCTVDANGDCDDDSFVGLSPGTYTIDETAVPDGYDPDPDLPYTFTLAAAENLVLEFENVAQQGALSILKNSTKGDGTSAVANDGAEFTYDDGTDTVTVVDNGPTDEDSDVGEVCVSGLAPGDYTVNETSPPDGYGDSDATEADQTVSVENGTDCGQSAPGAGATATFHNPPLSDIQVNFRDGGSGETSAVIDCDETSGTEDLTATSGWDTSETVTGIEGSTTVTCTIVIDP